MKLFLKIALAVLVVTGAIAMIEVPAVTFILNM